MRRRSYTLRMASKIKENFVFLKLIRGGGDKNFEDPMQLDQDIRKTDMG